MFKLFLLCVLFVQVAWTKPLQQHGVDIAAPAHVVIVTPQAQVHLEPALKYDSSPAFFQHLTPLARIAAPHEETVVYVPASAAASAPLFSIGSSSGVQRSSSSIGELLLKPATKLDGDDEKPQTEDPISVQAGNFQNVIQQSVSLIGEGFNEAAGAAAAAGQSFWPNPSLKPEKKDPGLLEQSKQPIALQQPLLSLESGRFYAVAPQVVLPQVVDFVHTPYVYNLASLSAIRARSLEEKNTAVVAVPFPEALKPQALPLTAADNFKTDSEQNQLNLAEKEKNENFGKLTENEEKLAEISKKDDIKLAAESAPVINISEIEKQNLSTNINSEDALKAQDAIKAKIA